MSTDVTPAGEGQLLWRPHPDARERTRMGRYFSWVEEHGGRRLPDYHTAWAWSVDDLEGFWRSIWDFFEVTSHAPAERVLTSREMPGTQWFPGATLNYAEHALRRRDDAVAVVSESEARARVQLTRAELARAVAGVQAGLQRLGVQKGDRVVAYLPNVSEALIACLAATGLGAIWSSCAPEFGTRSVVDRFAQVEPTVLLAVDGYRYGGRDFDRTGEVEAIRAELPTLRATVLLPHLHGSVDRARNPDVLSWDELLGDADEPTFEPVAFDHPLWILYSSGTTGLPKPIVHGHGGILLEHLKMLGLHHDLGEGDRFFWFSTTGWMMWNYLVSSQLVGATTVMFDGNPAHPDLTRLFALAADTGITNFGVSAPFLLNCLRAGLEPGARFDLSRIKEVGSTGAPLPPEGFRWVYEHVGDDLVLASASGGTDTCTAFCGATPLLPVYAGELSCRCLGAKVESFDAEGKPQIGERGELVITEPMPSMPVMFWNDPDGSRLRASYFEDYPGVWRHGDWLRITERGTCVITGRSDATLNRGGVRMGTSEFYSVVEGLPEIADSLVVHLEDRDTDELVLFVVPAGGATIDDEVRARIARELRQHLSPRHVPDEVHVVPQVPRTLSGKKLEVPIKRILAGEDPERAASRGALADPTSLDHYVALAATRR